MIIMIRLIMFLVFDADVYYTNYKDYYFEKDDNFDYDVFDLDDLVFDY